MIKSSDVDFYNEQGYLLVRGVFTMEEVEGMRKSVEGVIRRAAKANMDANAAWDGDHLPKEQIKRLVLKGFHNMEYHDSTFLKALAHPNMVSVLNQLIGPNVQLHHSKMLVKPPENGAAFPMHQDYPYFPHQNDTMLAASVHLDDSNEENGCLRVIPGSHKQGALPHRGRHYLNHKEYPISEGTPCPAKSGDVLFFNYLTVHGSDVNQSDRTRRNVLFQYRDASDLPIDATHFDWGMGLTISGENPHFEKAVPGYKIVQ